MTLPLKNSIGLEIKKRLESIDSQQAQINALVVNGDSSPQAAQASVGADNTDYEGNLKARLDAEYNKTNQKIDDNQADTAAQLADLTQQKTDKITTDADRLYFENKINMIINGQLSGSYASLADLQNALPNGAQGVYYVSADGNWYFWLDGSGWTSGGAYLNALISDETNLELASLAYGKVSIDYNAGTISVAKTQPNGSIILGQFNTVVSAPDQTINFDKTVANYINFKTDGTLGCYQYSSIPKKEKFLIIGIIYDGKVFFSTDVSYFSVNGIGNGGWGSEKFNISEPASLMYGTIDIDYVQNSITLKTIVHDGNNNSVAMGAHKTVLIILEQTIQIESSTTDTLTARYLVVNSSGQLQIVHYTDTVPTDVLIVCVLYDQKVYYATDLSIFTVNGIKNGGWGDNPDLLNFYAHYPVFLDNPVLSSSVALSANHVDTISISSPYGMSTYGIKLKQQDVTFNAISIPFKFLRDVPEDAIIICDVRRASDMLVLEHQKVSCRVLATNESGTLGFRFNRSFNLNDGLAIIINIVDKDNQYINSGLGFYVTDGPDSNLFTGDKSSVIYIPYNPNVSYPSGQLSYVDVVNPDPYYGFYYTLYNIMDESKQNEKTVVFNARDDQARDQIKELTDQVTQQAAQVEQLSTPASFVKPLLKFRKCQGNFYEFPSAYFMGRWMPRTLPSSSTGMVTINEGSEIYFRVRNTATVSAIFEDLTTDGNTPYIAYSVDGGLYTRAPATGTIQIASGIDNTKEHFIRMVVSSIYQYEDVWNNFIGLAIKGIAVDSGGIIDPVSPNNRIGLYIGDSITAGVRVLGVPETPDHDCAEQNYVYNCCKSLNAANIRAGFGGTSVDQGGSGGVPLAIEFINNLMNGVHLDEDAMPSPDFIAINMGSNGANSDPTTFQLDYLQLIKCLQIKYSGVPIFCIRPFGGFHESDIEAVLTDPSASDCIYVDTTGWGITYSDGLHPDVAGSLVAGQKLAEFMLSYFGWRYFL
jgi:hypothetical protein